MRRWNPSPEQVSHVAAAIAEQPWRISEQTRAPGRLLMEIHSSADQLIIAFKALHLLFGCENTAGNLSTPITAAGSNFAVSLTEVPKKRLSGQTWDTIRANHVSLPAIARQRILGKRYGTEILCAKNSRMFPSGPFGSFDCFPHRKWRRFPLLLNVRMRQFEKGHLSFWDCCFGRTSYCLGARIFNLKVEEPSWRTSGLLGACLESY